jgi:hypothetical protein
MSLRRKADMRRAGGYRWPNAGSVERDTLRKIVRAEIGEAGTGAEASRQLAERLPKHDSLRSRGKRNGCATSKHGWQAKRQ